MAQQDVHPGSRRAGESAVLVVTGAHLSAEVQHRPAAYRVAEAVQRGLAARAQESTLTRAPDAPTRAIVCSDLWYLNHEELRRRPTISIGGPELNAVTATMAEGLPTVFAVDRQFAVQLDPDYFDHRVCCWGVDGAATARAADLFIQKHLDGYLDALVIGV